MTRCAVAFDRAVVFLAGLALAALGCFLSAWRLGVVDVGAGAVRVAFAGEVDRPWWPWVSAAGGVVLALLGFWWLATHRWPRKAARVALVPRGRGLTADATSVADAAADALKSEAAVRKSSGTATIERGAPIITVSATVPARRGVQLGIAAADRIAGTVRFVIGDTVAVRTVLRIDSKSGPAVS
jgi:hypothetical protein